VIVNQATFLQKTNVVVCPMNNGRIRAAARQSIGHNQTTTRLTVSGVTVLTSDFSRIRSIGSDRRIAYKCMGYRHPYSASILDSGWSLLLSNRLRLMTDYATVAEWSKRQDTTEYLVRPESVFASALDDIIHNSTIYRLPAEFSYNRA
jgi:hypothetical protein